MERAANVFCMTTHAWIFAGGEADTTFISVMILTNTFALARFYSILSRYFH